MVGFELLPDAEAANSKQQLEDWEEAYLNSQGNLRFKVSLPSESEYTPKFRFAPQGEGSSLKQGESGGQGGKLVFWPAAPPSKLRDGRMVGSKIAEQLGFKGFELPNGKVLRLFHASTKRNWKAPPQEPVEPLASSLVTVGLPELPPHPHPPQPSRRDVQKLTQADVKAPKPRVEKRAAATFSYGDTSVEEETLSLYVVPASAGGGGAAAAAALLGGSKRNQEFELHESIFASRRLNTDGRTFYDDEQVYRRAFEIDFARCNQERFRLLIREEDDDTAGGGSESTEIGEIKEVLGKHMGTFYRAFMYYSGVGYVEERGDGYSLGVEDYEEFVKRCKLADEASSRCKKADLSHIFDTTNEEEATLEEEKEMAEVNLDHALMRFEFMQALVRIAIAKYVHGGEADPEAGGRKPKSEKIDDVSEALDTLMSRDIAPNLPPEANVVPDVFRRGRLYTRAVHEALEKTEPQLRAIYDFYAGMDEEPEEGVRMPIVKGAPQFARKLNMCLDEWFMLLEDAALLDGEEEIAAKEAEIAELRTEGVLTMTTMEFEAKEAEMLEELAALRRQPRFTRKEAVLCFQWSQPFVTDEIKRREKQQHLSFLDFCEALCRVITFKPLPTQEMLKAHSARSCAHFFLQEEQGVHEGRKLCRPQISWREDKVDTSGQGGAALRPPLEMLISLIFERLSATGDMLTRQELKKRLVARAEAKRLEAEEKRLALEEDTTPRVFGDVTDILAGAMGVQGARPTAA